MEIINLKNIHYSYPEGIKVFEGLDFLLKQGERIGIVGPNGSGKTTLFSILMGLLTPQKGEVALFGRKCGREKDFIEARKKMGYLFQDPDDQIFCPTVEEDICFGPLNLGVDEQDVRACVDKVTDEFGISGIRERITTKLSWGQKRLVSLAGLIVMRPDILILDEPTASIDEEVVDKITRYLKGSGYSLLIASHDKLFLDNLCDRIYILKNGYFNEYKTSTNLK